MKDRLCESSPCRHSHPLVDLAGMCSRGNRAVQSPPLLPSHFSGLCFHCCNSFSAGVTYRTAVLL